MGLSIKDHIDQGHYPTDEKGRALVPTRGAGTAVILATDLGGIIGWNDGALSWSVNGQYRHIGEAEGDLLPPPPKKVKVTQHVTVSRRTGKVLGSYDTHDEAEGDHCREEQRIVELTGEYEEEWK